MFCVAFARPAGQDGTLQSFSTVHERFNKNLGHGKLSPPIRLCSKNVTF